MYRFTINSQFNFGDNVEFVSPHTSGKGKVTDIVLEQTGRVYYLICDEAGDLHGGIYPEQMKLLNGDD